MKVTRLSSRLGATVEDLDVDALDDEDSSELRRALLDVLFFPALDDYEGERRRVERVTIFSELEVSR